MHVPRIQKAHIVSMGPPYSSLWVCRVLLWTLLEKVVDLRALQFWSNQTGIFDIYRFALNLVKLSRIIILYYKGLWIMNLFLLIFLDSWYFCINLLILKLVSTHTSKNDFKLNKRFWKNKGWRFDFCGPKLFWQRGVD